MIYYKYTAYGKMGVSESAITVETQDKIRFVLSEYGKIKDEDYIAIIFCSEKKQLSEDEFLFEMFKYLSYNMAFKPEAVKYFQELSYNVNKG